MNTSSTTLIFALAIATLASCDDPVSDAVRYVRSLAAHHEILSMKHALSGVEGLGDDVLKQKKRLAQAVAPNSRGSRPGLGNKAADWNPSKPPDRPHQRIRGHAALKPVGQITTDIHRVLARHRGRFRGCYERVLKTDPTVAGSLVVALEIPVEGKDVVPSIVTDEIKNERLSTCLLNQAKRCRFPAREEPIRIDFSLTFTLID